MRIVSLLPAATDLVVELGLAAQLVGVTHACDLPRYLAALPRLTRSNLPDVGSEAIDAAVREQSAAGRALYDLDGDVLARLEPDLILTQGVCAVCAVAADEVDRAVKRLPRRPTVVNLAPATLDDVVHSLVTIARAAGNEACGRSAAARLAARIEAVARRTATVVERPRVMLLEWLDPPFTAGHWSPGMVELAGGREVLGIAGGRSRATSWSEIHEADPELLFLACCGFDVERTLAELPLVTARPEFTRLTAVRRGAVFVVDGDAYFSRPGPRLVAALELLARTLHPALFRAPPCAAGFRRLSPAELTGR
jgi:iron complex transport system substrate-binding protein